MMDVIDCPVCRAYKHCSVWKEHGLDILQCQACGFLFTNPLQLAQKRPDEYWDHAVAETDHGFEFQQATMGEREWWDMKRPTFEDALKVISQVAPGKRLLDAGCGLGYFVKLASERGFDAQGIEPNPVACEFACKELGMKHIKTGTLEEDSYPPDLFDAISFLNVLEHVLYPGNVVAVAYRLLRPGGVIFIRVPNVRFHMPVARLRRTLQLNRVHFLGPGDHVNQFSPQSLGYLLSACGFEPMQLLPGRATLAVEGNIGESKFTPVGIWCKLAYYAAATMLFRLGRNRAYLLPTITAYARKPKSSEF